MARSGLSLVVVLLFCVAFAVSMDSFKLKSQFDALIAKHGRTYASDDAEYSRRFSIFQENAVRLELSRKNDPGAKHDFNKFFDVSREEFNARNKGFKKASVDALARSCLTGGVTAPRLDVSALPTSFDWRDKKVVTPVKNQEACGSCWAFSTAGNIESQWAIKKGALISLSEQEIVDCSKGCVNEPPYGNVCNSGCEGGWPWTAYNDLITMGGLEREDVYPYAGIDEQCTFNRSKVVVTISNYTCLTNPNENTGADEKQMAAYLVANGPLSIALNAEWLQDYYGGVTWPWECDGTSLDHAVLIVGYGTQTGWLGEQEDFWIVKNSWGSDWGESGYFRIGRGAGVCGVNNAVSSAVI